MNDKIVVKTEEIRQIAQNINAKREEIKNVYSANVLPILNSSEECLKVSGLNYEEVLQSFNSLFNSLDAQLNSLSDVLVNKVIPGYENVSDVIKKLFNSTLADQISQAMTKMNS